MKALGYLLITAGFLTGSYTTVRDPSSVDWLPFAGCILGGALGVALVRTAIHRSARSAGRIRSNVDTAGSSLRRIAESAERLDRDKVGVDVYDLRHLVEETFADDLAAFVDARESIAHRYGMQPYADIMTHFAAGERHLNRVWSASTDGYVEEAHAYVTHAAEQFRDARDAFAKLTAIPEASP